MTNSDHGSRTPAARAIELTKSYGSGDAAVRALDGVSVEFELPPERTSPFPPTSPGSRSTAGGSESWSRNFGSPTAYPTGRASCPAASSNGSLARER
jgi:hypothetical protein